VRNLPMTSRRTSLAWRLTLAGRPAVRIFCKPALLFAAASLCFSFALCPAPVRAADAADTAANYERSGADLADAYVFPSPTNANNVVLVMDVHALIPAGQSASFDPNVLYQFKIDTTGDAVEDLVIQARFTGTGANQSVVISGPAKPLSTGTTTRFGRPDAVTGTINQTFSPVAGMQVFAGLRSDPFFFDLSQFYKIFPDRETPLTGSQEDFPSIMAANTSQANGFRGFPAGSGFNTATAADYFANLNVLSIVVELPKSALGGGVIRLWETTSIPNNAPAFTYAQQDREGRPAIKTILSTVTDNRHEVNDTDNPTDDRSQLKNDILSFFNFPAGRSPAISNAAASMLVPDVLVADLSQSGKASYLGVETGGFTGGKFGGRALSDDVLDIDLQTIFGPLIPALGLAPDDGREMPQFTTDNIGPHTDYLTTFPYLATPH
jgi:hypothetical protein